MKKRHAIGGLCALLLMGHGVVAQDFSLDAEFRPRVEYREGFQKPLTTAQRPNMIVLNRTRLGASYASEHLRARFTLQDSRIWGATDLSPAVPFRVFEAWAQVLFNPQLSLSVGRQALAYDHNRLFAASNWTIDGKSHDLALLRFANADLNLRADLGLAVNNPNDALAQPLYNDGLKLYRHMEFLRVEQLFVDKKLKTSAIFLSEGFQKVVVDTSIAAGKRLDGAYGRHTVGANVELNDKDFPVNALITGYYQFGRNPNTMMADPTSTRMLSAYLLAAKVGCSLGSALGAHLGADFYSGTSATAEADNTWNKLYGSNHSHNGNIEYWRSLPQEGLIDAFAGLSVKHERLSAGLVYHLFSSQHELRTAGCSGSGLGSELDITLQFKFAPDVTIEGGWSTYLCNDNTRAIKNVLGQELRFAHWAYVSFTIKPKLFSYKSPKADE